MLNRLLVRERVNLLVVLPLTVVLFMTVPFIADRLQSARLADTDAQTAASVRQIGRLVEGLGRERALSVIYVLTPNASAAALTDQTEAVRDEVYGVRRFYGGQPPAAVERALTGVGALDPIRSEVQADRIHPNQIEAAYDTSATALIDSLNLSATQSSTASAARGYIALDALMQADEQSSRAATDAMGALLDPRASVADRAQQVTAAEVAEQIEQQQVTEFQQNAARSQITLYAQVAHGQAASRVQALEKRIGTGSGGLTMADGSALQASQTFAAVETEAVLNELVQDKIARDTAAESSKAASQAQLASIVYVVLAIALFAATVTLSIAIGRSVARPLWRLISAASKVADLASAELARVTDEEGEELGPPRLAAINLDTRDEIGELAGAVNRVQAAATLLLERQIAGRANIAVMFGSVGRRAQNLVSRQTAVIDRLERDERDPDVLEQLYRLDHLTARLRRHADSLLVLSGRSEPSIVSTPAPLGELIRSALGRIEDYRRIELTLVDEAWISPEIAGEMDLLLAELLDNATRFSPPTTRVQVSARLTEDACRITIVDHGVGMSPGIMKEENERLVHRERLDLVPTDVLGLFVVGRLSRRRGLRTFLTPSPESGVTAQVEIPRRHLMAAPAGGIAGPRTTAPAAATTGERQDTQLQQDLQPRREPQPRREAPPVRRQPERRPASPPPDRPAARDAQPAAGDSTGLVRRVPGAQLPGGNGPADMMPSAPPSADPEEARALLDGLEAGISMARVQHAPPPAQSFTPPAPPVSAPGADIRARTEPEPALSSAYAFTETIDHVRASVERLLSAHESRPGGHDANFGWFQSGASTGHEHPGRDTGTNPYPGLPRRVPGAQLAADHRNTMTGTRLGRPQDAYSVRSDLDAFEAAIAQAKALRHDQPRQQPTPHREGNAQ